MTETCKNFLAVDIGASSGRHIVGTLKNGELTTTEVYRFQTGFLSVDGHLINDVAALTANVIEGIRRAFERFGTLESVAIDTWGVDYVLMKNGSPILPVYAYRDERTDAAVKTAHGVLTFEKLYQRTGCQFQPFNTLYQLVTDRDAGRLDGADDFLMLPEYLNYALTGVKKKEFTNATTTGLVNAETLNFDKTLIEKLNLPTRLFTPLFAPGTPVSPLKKEIADAVGGNTTVVLCASHDTASAVEGVDVPTYEPYVSSGTWSLVGIKTERPVTTEAARAFNFSNEGGVGYNRLQKNVAGMWVVNNLKNELCQDLGYGEIEALAFKSAYEELVDFNKPDFFAPESMRAAVLNDLAGRDRPTPQSLGDWFALAYRSVAASYAETLNELSAVTGKTFTTLTVFGGAAKNGFFKKALRELCRVNIVTLPIEATCLGNLKIQIKRYHERKGETV